jgi:non-ribosomal peptide synthetase component F/acyl carrier protein
MWGALLHGGKLVVPSHWTIRSPEALARMLAGERVTVLNATPSLFSSVMDELLAVAGHLALRVVVFGGEALRPAALARWFEHFGDAGPALVNMYGITETTVHVTYQRLDAAAVAASASPIGEPLPDLELHLLDERGEPVPVGVPGEIHVGGAGVARGYLNRPELTAERFVPNPFGPGRLYRSGDLARRLGTGALDFIGRADSQVKVRGYRIELGEIESTLLGHEAVSEAAVIATDVGPGDTRLAAYVVPKPGTREGDPRVALQAHLEERLPSYMVPASIIVLAALPRTPNGKLDPRALPAPTWQQAAEPGGGHVAPRTETEEAIAEVWQRVLGIDRVSSEDSFFALGGHSLLAARIATEVRRRFAIELSVRALFDHPTLAGFAESVDAARAPAPAGEPSQEAGSERADEERHPLSSQQQQLLYFDALRPGTPVYNAALAVAVDGPLDVDALRRALDGVIARHEPLRTVFAWEQGEPVQRVLSEWATDLTVVEVADGDAASEELRRLQRQHARRPFDLATDATLRASVFRLGPRRHVVLLQPHHISVDGWSVDILFSELSELYEAERTGRPHTLAPLGRRYLDFARWQREQAGSPRREDDVGYWRRQLAGARDTPPLRPDRPRPAEQTFEGATLVVDFPPSLAEAVTEVARARQVTPYMVLLAAFGVLLQRSGGSDDILVGTPTANRGLAEFEPLIGYFANTLALRVRLGGNPTFSELLERVRSTTLEAIEHEELPFEQVVEAVGSRRDPAINPLFQVNFRARVDGPPQLRLGEASTHWSMADIGISRFDLALEVHVTEDGLECLFEHNTDLFDTATVEALARDYGAVLEHVAREPDSRLLAIPAGAQAESPGRPAGIRGFRGRSDSHSTAG